MSTTFLTLTETQAFTALASFLVEVLPAGTDVIRGQINRVPEPAVPNFVVMSQLRAPRLSTNIAEYDDDIVTASIAGTVMTVGAVLRGSITPGALLTDGTVQQIHADTVVVSQLTGTTGGAGTYRVSPSQTLASGTLYAGVRLDLVPTEWTVQLDFHGPLSADNSKIVEGLFRSEVAIDSFAASNPDIAPLYCDEPSQRPFFNAEQELEFRWSVDAVMQLNPIIGTPLQFADELEVTTIEVEGGTTHGPIVGPVPIP